MLAVFEEAGVAFQVRVAAMPRDPALEINAPAFLKVLRCGSPAAEWAFRDLVRSLRAPLIGFIGRWLREADAVEDVLQETFLAVHRGLPRFEGKCRLTTWVYSLAYRKAMDRLSEKYRPGCGSEETDLQYREIELADPLPDEAAHQSLLVARIRSIADTLPEEYRQVWRLSDVDGLSGEEVAQALGITPNLARVRLHRARFRIGACLRKEIPGIPT